MILVKYKHLTDEDNKLTENLWTALNIEIFLLYILDKYIKIKTR